MGINYKTMTLSTDKQKADRIIDAMVIHYGPEFMCEDQTGKTISQVVAQRFTFPKIADTIIGKIALTALGSNLPSTKEFVRNLKFVNK